MKRIAAVILFLSAFLAQAQSIYISQNGSGNQSGTDSNDCQTIAWVNAAGPNGPINWGTGANQIGLGATIHLVGTMTNGLSVFGGGTPGNPLTIYFEPGAMFSAPTLPPNSPWMNIGNMSNIVIDGGVNGLIQLTDNGTVAANGGTCDYGNGGIVGIYAYPICNVIIKNLTISNLYNRQIDTEASQGQGDGCAIYWSGSGLTVSNCYLTGCQDMISGVYGSPATSNLTVVGCTLSNFNHGVTVGSGGVVNPFFYNVSITHNTIQGGDMYETSNGMELYLHRDPIFFFNESPDGSGYISNIVIAYNFIKQGFKPQSTSAGSGAMFFNINSTMALHVRVFNNISTLVYPLSWSSDESGMIQAVGTDVLVANNTAVGWLHNGIYGGNQISVYGTNAYLYNNICTAGAGEWIWTFLYNTNGLTNNFKTVANLLSGIWSDYNIYNGQGGGSFYDVIMLPSAATWYTAQVNSFSQWTNMWYSGGFSNFDVHSLTNAVQFDSTFIPLSTDTVAVGNGTNLTAWGITDDYAGNPRPATGNWTIGAYQTTDSIGSNFNIFSNVNIGSGGGVVVSFAPGIDTFVAGGGGADITNGLLVHYQFNQTNGTAAIDSSGNGNTGILKGNAGWTNGLAGAQAVLFSSNSDVTCSMSYSGDWTVAYWIYLNSFPGSFDYAWSTTPATGVFVCPNSWGFYDGSTILSGSTALSANAWYFLAVSKSLGTNYQLYLNGATNASGVLNNVEMVFSEVGNNSYGQYMNGMMADFRIYDRVLSNNEISILAANGPDDVAATLLTAPQNLHVISLGP